MKQNEKVKEESKNHRRSSQCSGDHLSRCLRTYVHVVWMHTYPPEFIHKDTSVFTPRSLFLCTFWVNTFIVNFKRELIIFLSSGTSIILWVFTDTYFWEEQRFFGLRTECFFSCSMLIGIYFSLHLLKDDFKTNFFNVCSVSGWQIMCGTLTKLIPKSSFKHLKFPQICSWALD